MRTRFPHTKLIVGAGAIAAALSLAACGSESSDTNTPSATAGQSGVNVEVGNTINYMSVGTTTDIDCADGKSLNVAGSNNSLTVRGRCEAVNVAGADNRITVERVEKSLTVTGLNNSVTYRGGEPTVDDRGSGNVIADKR